MPYLHSLNAFLQQTSLLLQAYPSTRITTKYSLPRKRRLRQSQSEPHQSEENKDDTPMPDAKAPTTSTKDTTAIRERPPPAATLTVKAYHPDSGICLKYQTDKVQEVGRLMGGLGRLARGETIEEPSVASTTNAATGQTVDADQIDGMEDIVQTEDKAKPAVQADSKAQQPQQQHQQQQGKQAGGGGGAKKKKKGKR